LQQPILPGHSALMLAMAATIQFKKWIQMRLVTIHQIITSALLQTCSGAPPLILCFICCNSHPTIPNSFKDDLCLGRASVDTQRDQGNGSRHYKVNIWMWSYGRGSPGWCPSQRLRGSGASVSARAGAGQQRLGSYAARPLLRPALPRVAAELNKVLVMISYLISYFISFICLYDIICIDSLYPSRP
jgi:hypothetical protein